MTPNPLSRRSFLKAAGLSLGTAAAACAGLGGLAARPPKIETPHLALRKDHPMNQRVLVAYATRAGATAEIAAAVGETLSRRGFAVDVRPVKENPSLEGCHAVVLGSAIRMGAWLPEATAFIQANQAALAKMPHAFFTVHMLNAGEDEASRAARRAYLDGVRSLLPSAESVYFTGRMDFSRLSLVDRLIAKMVKAVESDQRDWDKIRRWAETVLA